MHHGGIKIICTATCIFLTLVPTLTDDPEDVLPLYFLEEPRRAIVIEGESVTLPCQTNVKNGLKTLWIKDRQTLRENITFSFRLTSITRADHGMYRCAAFNDHGGILSKQLAVEVGYLDNPPYNATRTLVDIPLGESIIFWPFFYAHSDRSSLTVSTEVNNTYSFAFPPPQARWTINNAPVTASSDVYISSMEQALVLLNVDRNLNFKVVRAQLTNGYGPMTVVQRPIFSSSYIIQTKEPPPNRSIRQLNLILAPKDVTLALQNNETGSATFECVFNARPAGALRVQWFRKRIGNRPYEQFEPISLMHQNFNFTDTKHHRTYLFDPSGFNRSITIQNIRLSNLVGYSEEYICQGYLLDSSFREQGQSSLGSDDLASPSTEFSSGPLSATARLWIHTPPVLRFGVGLKTITSSFKNGRARAAIVEGVASSDTKMVCTFENDGHPNSTISWLKNAKKVSKNDPRIFVNSDHQLVITHLQIEDAGIYQCHAQNSAGEDMLAFWLKVTSFGPQLQSGREEKTELTVLEKTKTHISCPIIGAPRPVYYWFRARTRAVVAPPSRLSALMSDSLRLECVVLAHSQTRVQFNWLHGRPKQEHNEEHNEDVSKRKFISGAGSAQKYSSFDIAHFNRSLNVSSFGDFTEMQYGSVLTVERLSQNDAGIYVCQVISSTGNITFNTEVAVFSPPSPPDKFRILYDDGTIKMEENASESHGLAPGNLDLECLLNDENDNPPIESVILFAKQTGTYSNMSAKACKDIKEPSWSMLSLSPVNSSRSNPGKFTSKVPVKELLPGFSYCFAVAATNRLGWSELAYQENLAIFIPFQEVPPNHLPNFFTWISDKAVGLVWMTTEYESTVLKSTNYQFRYRKKENHTVRIKRASVNHPVSEVILDELEPQTEYVVKVVVCNPDGCTILGQGLNVYTARTEYVTAPTNVRVESVGANFVSVNFHSPFLTTSGEQTLLGYQFKLTCIDPPGCPSHEKARAMSDIMFPISIENNSGMHRISKDNIIMKSNLTDLSPMTLYELRIASITPNGVGPFGDEVEIFRTSESVPGPVVRLRMQTVNKTTLLVQWQDPAPLYGRILNFILKYNQLSKAGGSNQKSLITERSVLPDDLLLSKTQSLWQRIVSQTLTGPNLKHGIIKIPYNSRNTSPPVSNALHLHQVMIDNLFPDERYIVAVHAVSSSGSGPTSIVYGCTSLTDLNTTANFAMENWLHVHRKYPEYMEKAVLLYGLTFRFVGGPDVQMSKGNQISINITLELNREVRQGETIAGNLKHAFETLESFPWPVQFQSLSLLGVDFGQIREDWEDWQWNSRTSVKRLSTPTDVYSFGSLKRLNVQLLISVDQPTAFAMYRFRIWPPLYVLFDSASNVTKYDFVQHSQPTEWITSILLAPRIAPRIAYLTVIDANRLKATWQPLSLSEWNGVPGGYIVTAERSDVAISIYNNTMFHELDQDSSPRHDIVEHDRCGIRKFVKVLYDPNQNQLIIGHLQPATNYYVTIQPFSKSPKLASVVKEQKNGWTLLLGPKIFLSPGDSMPTTTSSKSVIKTWDAVPTFRPLNVTATEEGKTVHIEWIDSLEAVCHCETASYELEISSALNLTATTPVYSVKWIDTFRTEITASQFNHGITSTESPRMKRISLLKETLLVGFWRRITPTYCTKSETVHILRIRAKNRVGFGPFSDPVVIPLVQSKEKTGGRLHLKRILITQEKSEPQTHGRVLFSWLVSDQVLKGLDVKLTITWFEVDPITHLRLGATASRVLHSPPIKNEHMKHKEVLIAIDRLNVGAVYRFKLTQEPSSSMSMDVTEDYVTAYIIQEDWLMPPSRKPHPPRRWLRSNLADKETPDHTPRIDCNSAIIVLAWPAYPSSIISNLTHAGKFGPIYTAPVKNYSLQYAQLPHFVEGASAYGVSNASVLEWKEYEPAPQPGDEEQFYVFGLQPNTAYVFRTAVRTDGGRSPYSEPSAVLRTSINRPCEVPKISSVMLVWTNRTTLLRHYGVLDVPEDKHQSPCQAVQVTWLAIADKSWNGEPLFYQIVYQFWLSKDSVRHVSLVKAAKGQRILRAHLPPLPARTYIELKVIPRSFAGDGDETETILVHTGFGCPRKSKKEGLSLTYMYDESKLDGEESDLALDAQFHCVSDTASIQFKCFWKPLDVKLMLGYSLTLIPMGSMSLRDDPTQSEDSGNKSNNHTLFVPPTCTSVLIYSLEERYAKLNAGKPSDWTIEHFNTNRVTWPLRPYFRYKVVLEAILHFGTAKPHLFPPMLSPGHDNTAHCGTSFLCTAQWIPTRPVRLWSEWLTRNSLILLWTNPAEVNGQVKEYLIVRTCHRPGTDGHNSDEAFSGEKTINQSITVSQYLNGPHPGKEFHIETNVTCLFEMKARTNSVWNGGWGPTACWLVSTDSHVPVQPPKSTDDCAFPTNKVDEAQGRLLPKLLRPVVREQNAYDQIYPSAVSAAYSEERLLNKKLRPESQVIHISWDLATRGWVSVTQFLLEIRFSSQVNIWHHLSTVNHTTRTFLLHLDDIRSKIRLHEAHSHDQTDVLNVAGESTSRAQVATSFARLGLTSDSPYHTAIQIRVSAASEHCLGEVGPESNWFVVPLSPSKDILHQRWWFLLLLAFCAISTIIGLGFLFYTSVKRQNLRNSHYLARKFSGHVALDRVPDCCLSFEPCPMTTTHTNINGHRGYEKVNSLEFPLLLSERYVQPSTHCMYTSFVGSCPRSPRISELQQSPMEPWVSSPPPWDTGTLQTVDLLGLDDSPNNSRHSLELTGETTDHVLRDSQFGGKIMTRSATHHGIRISPNMQSTVTSEGISVQNFLAFKPCTVMCRISSGQRKCQAFNVIQGQPTEHKLRFDRGASCFRNNHVSENVGPFDLHRKNNAWRESSPVNPGKHVPTSIRYVFDVPAPSGLCNQELYPQTQDDVVTVHTNTQTAHRQCCSTQPAAVHTHKQFYHSESSSEEMKSQNLWNGNNALDMSEVTSQIPDGQHYAISSGQAFSAMLGQTPSCSSSVTEHSLKGLSHGIHLVTKSPEESNQFLPHFGPWISTSEVADSKKLADQWQIEQIQPTQINETGFTQV
ncbi:hypothetical protein CRM22_001512 [Opisthorchis felineus]|uniref:Protein-tyrosine-phosphatase n=1 Tax=Opisthorchis felineus TaxID=147828 RepID=A0A4S2MEM5_OPIFE|nr:hypothetical protein CRM22_001512 [Opisthorchis felineus]